MLVVEPLRSVDGGLVKGILFVHKDSYVLSCCISRGNGRTPSGVLIYSYGETWRKKDMTVGLI